MGLQRMPNGGVGFQSASGFRTWTTQITRNMVTWASNSKNPDDQLCVWTRLSAGQAAHQQQMLPQQKAKMQQQHYQQQIAEYQRRIAQQQAAMKHQQEQHQRMVIAHQQQQQQMCQQKW